MSNRRSNRRVSVVWGSGSGGRTLANELLRAEVGSFLGIPAAEVRLTRSCVQCGSSEHGRPVVLPQGKQHPPFVSLSRAGATVAVAVSDCGPVGVDVERLDAARFAGFGQVALHGREVASTIEARAVSWVRKESLLKATGHGLGVDPRLIRLSDANEPPRLLDWFAPDPPGRNVWMQDFEVDGCAACLTVLTDVAPQVNLRQAALEVPAR